MNAVRFLLIALVLAFGGTHVATAGDMDTVDQATQTRYHSLIAELRCVVCQNRSIAESDVKRVLLAANELKSLASSGALRSPPLLGL